MTKYHDKIHKTGGWTELIDDNYPADPYAEILDQMVHASHVQQEFRLVQSRRKKNSKVLVVDDDENATHELSDTLRQFGIEVLEANDALTALHMAYSDHCIQVVVTDLRMPGAGGLELISKLQKPLTRELDTIVISGEGIMSDVQEAMKYGATAFLSKPVDIQELMDALKKLVWFHELSIAQHE